MSQFTFLQAEFPAIYESANKAFSAAHPDPCTACFYARRALELTVNWLYNPHSADVTDVTGNFENSSLEDFS
ncbi:MAG: DUF4145 domain-containing protein [Goleter apudmare HA4340-LM2]|jgi:hypothetical protein|nr:DUF4145 domain-containing protein [Goleter apudmare HA4340-LM2]